MGEVVTMMSMEEREIAADRKRTHFVLVHGIGGGAWCWYKIRCLMENCGYKVSCIDLKGAGSDRSDADSILSFDDYNQPLMDFMSALPDTDEVILVGHSAGGLSVTQATHKFPNKIRLAVYVAATMLKSGYLTDQDIKDVKTTSLTFAVPVELCCVLVWFSFPSYFAWNPKLYRRYISLFVSLFSVTDGALKSKQLLNVKQGVPDLSQFGDVYELGFGLGAEQPPTSAIVKKELQRKIIYQMSPQEDSTLAAMLLRSGPILALMSARFKEEDDSVEKVRRVYIRTMHDNVIKPDQQEAMIKKWPPSHVHVVDSDHSPFFSAPFSLFGILLKVAATSAGCN
ncbi:Methylesterase 17 [Hibiscus syriacus]|uniref:Methylesterase 17 n=1 Tax=Hibiscus syriacus TaxID=106335 RepID=A0A6A2YSC1_HIBSY|nr:Methylesterase 17 [Hibiscus syriacus]